MKFNLDLHCSNKEVSYSLYDGYDQPRLERINTNRTIELDKGIYFLEAELNGIVKQVKIRLDQDKSVNVPLPIYSSMPLYNAATTNENKLKDGLKYSSQLTDLNSGNTEFTENGLFIFLRSSDLNLQTIQPNKFKISILGHDFNVIRKVNSSNSIMDKRDYWMAYSCEFKPGQYFIQIELQDKAWCFPVYIYPQIKANIFLSVKEIPLYRSLKIFYNRGSESFNPKNEYLMSTDIALDRFANFQFDNLPSDTMNELLNGKFEQPMFGFLALYFLLLRKNRSEKRLVEIVINNMEKHILRTDESPELDILKRMANTKFDTNFQINKRQNVLVPMFSFGLDTLIREWNFENTLFDEKSPINDATENLLQGTPFTIWSVSKYKRQRKKNKIKIFDNKKHVKRKGKYIKLINRFLERKFKSDYPNVIQKKDGVFIDLILRNLNINEDKAYLLMEYLYLGGKNNVLTIDLIIKEIRISPYKIRKVLEAFNYIIDMDPKILPNLIKGFSNGFGLSVENKELERIEENIRQFILKNSVISTKKSEK